MSDHVNPGLALDEVSRRFADSERALAEARERLQGLAQAEESAAVSAAALRQSAESVAGFAQTAASLVGELEEAQRQAREVLEAGARFLDGSELGELKEAVANLSAAVLDRLDKLERRVGDVEAAERRATEFQVELERRTATLSGRQRRRLGLPG